MNKEEKQLFKSLCCFKSQEFKESLLKNATPTVLGHLFFNRMQAVAYGVLKKHELLNKINREFRNSLQAAFEQNKNKNHSYFRCVKYLSEILSKCNCKYAMLKGALLCRYYPDGYRTSNDIDLLVLPEDVTEVGNVLTQAGFRQGHIINNEFVPASRVEIIESKMMRGETIPYIKEVNLPEMKYLEVDINFSLDYKSGDTSILKKILNRVSTISVYNLDIPTLDFADFFIHLCSHLYKEASTMAWVEMKRDMTLYKYCDIYLLLCNISNDHVDKIFERAIELGVDKVCAYAILHTAELFDVENSYAVTMAYGTLCNDPDFIHNVISPKDRKIYTYTERNISERFFSSNRRKLLKEVLK